MCDGQELEPNMQLLASKGCSFHFMKLVEVPSPFARPISCFCLLILRLVSILFSKIKSVCTYEDLRE